MSYEREEELRRRIDAADDEGHAATRELAERQADHHWQAGHRGRAMVVLHNSGWDDADMVRFARQRGLSEDEARAVITASTIDWS